MAEGLHLVEAERTNVDFPARDTEVSHQVVGVRSRPRGGAEAGHRQRMEQRARLLQGVERLAGDEQSERRIESARDTEGEARRIDMLDPLRQARDLSVKDFLAAL